MAAPWFLTVDAESPVIRAGIEAIARLRDDAEERLGVRVPITWFVRFQRTWDEYMEGESARAFAGPVTGAFDGFELAAAELRGLRERGDEIGWHYHAYHWVYRDDLPEAVRLAVLHADLAACAGELRTRHPDLAPASFRFGWFFAPHPSVYDLLAELGVERDASTHPRRTGEPPVPGRAARRLPPPEEPPPGISLFEHRNTLLAHDWEVVEHDLGWTRLDAAGAEAARADLARRIDGAAAAGAEFVTYAEVEPARAG